MPTLFNAVGIVAADLARSLDFYRRLGLDVPAASSEGHIDIALPNGFRLMLDSEEEVRKFSPGWVRQQGNQLSLAFQYDSPAEVDAIYTQMVSAGYHGEKAPWDAFWGQRYAQLHDPDGVPVDLYATL
ncbi:MAG: VOC family protein [Chloroflexota bacterium]